MRRRKSAAIKMSVDPICIDPEEVKDEIVYVRMSGVDVKQIDAMKWRFKIKSRSEMIRKLVIEALKRVE